ncbi:hypothetical protein C7S14_4858 [Burkholderia cepacia]|nr:hypothetical protein C7S14_4858 [Burkholderia cepacia]
MSVCRCGARERVHASFLMLRRWPGYRSPGGPRQAGVFSAYGYGHVTLVCVDR